MLQDMMHISDTAHCLRLKIYNILENESTSIFKQKGEWKPILEGLETNSFSRAHHSRFSLSKDRNHQFFKSDRAFREDEGQCPRHQLMSITNLPNLTQNTRNIYDTPQIFHLGSTRSTSEQQF
jgi:hypothetical protein